MARFTSTFVLSALLLAGTALAEPVQLTHQARLLDATGGPINGDVTLEFALYDAGDGLQWSGSAATTAVDGYVTAILENGTPTLDSDLLDDGPLFLDISVSQQILLPRQRLTATPHAAHASSVSGGEVVLPTASVGACTTDGAVAIDAVSGQLMVCSGNTYSTPTSLPDDCDEGAVLYRGPSGWQCTAGGTVLQELSTSTGSVNTATWARGSTGGTSQGTQILSLTLTPTLATSTLEVVAVGSVREPNNNSDNTAMGLFRDSSSSPLAVTQAQGTNNPYGAGADGSTGAHHETLMWSGLAGSTAATTIRLRIGTNNPGIACDRGPCTLVVRERL